MKNRTGSMTGFVLAATLATLVFPHPLCGEVPVADKPGTSAAPAASGLHKPTVVRFKENPIIRPAMVPGQDKDAPAGWNINFPSLIRVPEWLPNPLGKYYLYFSSHHGTYIRLAYADHLEGPWKIYEPGVMTLKTLCKVNGLKYQPDGHLASPDAHVDNAAKQIRMYFHAKPMPGHLAGVALSTDGLNFEPLKGVLGGPYFRVFQWQGNYYAIDRAANLLRSKDGLKDFQQVSDALAVAADDPKALKEGKSSNKPKKNKNKTKDDGDDGGLPGRVRHTGVMLDGDLLTVFFTRTGDAPESISMTRIRLNADPKTWRAEPPISVLAPETDYEGVNLPVVPSKGGTVIKTWAAQAGQTGASHALRDPYIYQENGRRYLLYSVAGERGIAIAEIKE